MRLAHDALGYLHLLTSIFALVFGTIVLVMRKGTKRHMKVGYLYFSSMVMVIITSFMIYRLFGRFGVFHYAAVFAAIVLALGMFPIWFKRPIEKWKIFHYNFMYWSVIALYQAFASELLTRIPESPFFSMVGLASGVILIIGFIIFFKNKRKWEKLLNVN